MEKYISIIALFFSIISFIISIKLKRRIDTRANSFDALYKTQKIFIKYPELRPYFYDNIILDKNHKDYYRALGIAEMFLDIFVNTFIRRHEISKSDWPAYEHYIKERIIDSYFLTEYLINNHDSLHPFELHTFIVKCIQEKITKEKIKTI